MNNTLSASAQKVQDALKTFGITSHVIELPASTRTAKEAADAVGCQIGQIVKSLVFRTSKTQKPILVATSGANRVNEEKISDQLDERIQKADADFVRQHTGFAIGGVPPVGLTQQVKIFIDQDLMQYDEIWAAAGTPNAVFCLTPSDLEKITTGIVISVA